MYGISEAELYGFQYSLLKTVASSSSKLLEIDGYIQFNELNAGEGLARNFHKHSPDEQPYMRMIPRQ
jgi:hypothetical protein